MISSLKLVDFKNFDDETLRVGPFTVVVGANASGKSNIRDAFRFLHGIGRGYSLADIIGGKFGTGGQIEWAPLRGGGKELIRLGQETLSVGVAAELEDGSVATYRISARLDNVDGFRLEREVLKVGSKEIFRSDAPPPDDAAKQNGASHLMIWLARAGDQEKGRCVSVSRDQPALTQIQKIKPASRALKGRASEVADILSHFRFLDPIPDLMRQPAFPGQTTLGNSGENLPTVLQKLCTDKGTGDALLDWTRELTPMDVAGFEFPRDSTTGLVQLVVREKNGRKISAYSASDGTLRFLAMLAALLDENPAGVYFFEEIDSGIHPSRLHLLADLIEHQTRKGAVQVITTTHSPELLSFVSDETFRNMSVVCRMDNTQDAVIRPVSELRNAEALRGSQGLGRLLAGGWMEDAIAFTEGAEQGEAE